MVQLEFDAVIGNAWELTKKHWLGLVLLMLAYGIISNVLQSFFPGATSLSDMMEMYNHIDDPRWLQNYQNDMAASATTPMAYVGTLVSILISIIYEVGSTNLLLRLGRGQVRSVSLDAVVDAFRLPVNTYVMVLAAGIVVAFVCGIGFMCCIIPGLYLCGALYPILYVFVDRPELDFVGAFKHAWALTKGNVFTIICLLLTCIVIMVMGLICCCVGVLPAAVLCEFVGTVIYLTLSAK